LLLSFNAIAKKQITNLSKVGQIKIKYPDPASNHTSQCKGEWTKRGVLDERMFNYCFRENKKGYQEVLSIVNENQKQAWVKLSYTRCLSKWTKRNVTQYRMVAHCVRSELEGIKDIAYYQKEKGYSKEIGEACFNKWVKRLEKADFHMVAYCIKKHFKEGDDTKYLFSRYSNSSKNLEWIFADRNFYLRRAKRSIASQPVRGNDSVFIATCIAGARSSQTYRSCMQLGLVGKKGKGSMACTCSIFEKQKLSIFCQKVLDSARGSCLTRGLASPSAASCITLTTTTEFDKHGKKCGIP